MFVFVVFVSSPPFLFQLSQVLGEPHFSELYANLCLAISEHNATWPFIKTIAYNSEAGAKYFWTKVSRQAEVNI